MKYYFMVSECDGNLYDTRKEYWYKLPPLRKNYAKIVHNVKVNSIALRAAIRAKFAWPGGYELFGLADDGACLCCDCMRREYYQIAYSRRYKIDDGWRVVAIDSAANYDSYIYCAHCNKTIVEDWERFNNERF